MAWNLGTLRTTLRDIINDAGAALWPDAALSAAILDAVGEYAHRFPLITRETYDVTLAANDVTGIEAESFVILAVECPPGTPLDRDPLSPNRSGNAALGTQGWTFRPNVIRLRTAASAGEAGVGKMVVWSYEYQTLPGTTAVWNGPDADVYFLLLLAHRAALQMLTTWQIGGQGVGGVTSALASVTEHFNPDAALLSIEVQIAREIAAREARYVGWWPLPPPIP